MAEVFGDFAMVAQSVVALRLDLMQPDGAEAQRHEQERRHGRERHCGPPPAPLRGNNRRRFGQRLWLLRRPRDLGEQPLLEARGRRNRRNRLGQGGERGLVARQCRATPGAPGQMRLDVPPLVRLERVKDVCGQRGLDGGAGHRLRRGR